MKSSRAKEKSQVELSCTWKISSSGEICMFHLTTVAGNARKACGVCGVETGNPYKLQVCRSQGGVRRSESER